MSTFLAVVQTLLLLFIAYALDQIHAHLKSVGEDNTARTAASLREAQRVAEQAQSELAAESFRPPLTWREDLGPALPPWWLRAGK